MSDQRQRYAELRPEGIDDRGDRHFSAWSDDRPLGRVRAASDHGWLRVSVDEDGVVNGAAERRALIAAVIALGAAEHASGLVLAGPSHLLLRREARAAGFTGPLRSDLVGAFPRIGTGYEMTPAHDAPQSRFLSDLQALLPGVVLTVTDRAGGRLRSLVRLASAGVAGTVHLTARWEDEPSATPSLRLAVPVSDDVIVEGVALVIDTALSVRRRFQPVVDGVRVFFDHSIQGLRTGSIAGVAEAYVRDVHLNPAYALGGEMEALDDYLRRRRANQDPTEHDRRPPLTVAPPATRIDSVVAHEYWHQIEFGLESGRYRDSIEFRRAVGEYFGVETVEQVIKGKSASAPDAWQIAYRRLAGEVSAYATTAPKEATAELFAQWWCTAAAPPVSARAFGDVLRRFFPDADVDR